MFLEARELADGAVRPDVCVIGGGAAGIALAVELAGASLRVVLLESGGLTPASAGQNASCVVPGRTPRLATDADRPCYLGGNTNHWYGNCRHLDDADFDLRDWVPYSGWPIARAELLPFYARAQHISGLGDFRWYEPETCRRHLEHQPLNHGGAVLETRMIQTCPVLSFLELHRQRLAASENVRIMLQTDIVRLKANARGDGVSAVETVGPHGRRATIEADAVIIACGGVESARLLLASNEAAPAGLGNDHDLVGRFFMEHWYVDLELEGWDPGHLRLYEGSAIREGGFETMQRAGAASVWAQLVLSGELMRAERLPGLGLWFVRSSRDPAGVAAARRIARSLREGALPEQPLSDIRLMLTDQRNVSRALGRKLGRRGGPPSDDEVYTLRVQIEQTPDPENRIGLSPRRERLGRPTPELALRLGEKERQDHLRALTIAADELGLDGSTLARRMGAMFAAVRFGFFFHHLGATRMSDDPAHGVVDGNCRVHGIANLFIAGSSVFPTGGSAPPTLTAVALAVRLADHLLQRPGPTDAGAFAGPGSRRPVSGAP